MPAECQLSFTQGRCALRTTILNTEFSFLQYQFQNLQNTTTYSNSYQTIITMLSFSILAFAGTLAAPVSASPPALLLPDSTRAECVPALNAVASCLAARSSSPLPIAGDGGLRFHKDTAACKAGTCCKDGEPFHVRATYPHVYHSSH